MSEWRLMNNELWTWTVALRSFCILIIEWIVNYLIICIRSFRESEEPSARGGIWPRPQRWAGTGDGSWRGTYSPLEVHAPMLHGFWKETSEIIGQGRHRHDQLREHSVGAALESHGGGVPRRWGPGAGPDSGTGFAAESCGVHRCGIIASLCAHFWGRGRTVSS